MGNSLSVDGSVPIHTFASSKSWIEGSTLEQLKSVATLPGVTAVAGMPDLHPGKYGPVGCAVLAELIHPALVGGDIGCGMALFALDLAARRVDAAKAAARLRVLAEPWSADLATAIAEAGSQPSGFDASLGSIGGGNHFCELQVIDDIVDADAAAVAGLDRERAFLLVHSGSRGLGTSILERTLANGLVALSPDSEDGRRYLADHDAAVQWAKLNRRIIATRAAEALRCEATLIADRAHNMVEVTDAERFQAKWLPGLPRKARPPERALLHRKGAAPADRGFVPVPGSRGTLSYLMRPRADAPSTALASLAHGAGRKYDRGSMHGRVSGKRSGIERLSRNNFSGVVVCENRDMLIEEAPEAYKNIGEVIGDLEANGLATVVASFKPIVTFKSVVDNHDRREKVKHRERGVDKRNRRLEREDGR